VGEESRNVAELSRKGPQLEDEQMLARLAVKHQFVSEEQIRKAMAFQSREREEGQNLSLEDVLVGQGMLSPKQLSALLLSKTFVKLRQPDREFGKFVVGSGAATQEQIDEILKQQAGIFKETHSFKALKDLLIEAGIIDARQRDSILLTMKRLRSQGAAPSEPERKPPRIETERQPARAEAAAEGREQPMRSSPGAPRDGLRMKSDREQGNVIVEDIYFDLIVSTDKLHVYLRLNDDVPETFTAFRIKNLLMEKEVSHGLASDAQIEAILKKKGRKGALFEVAAGVEPVPGKSATIQYLFSSEPVRAEVSSEKEIIDFKDRGEIPQVKQGDLLAQKIPKVEALSGIDVYGDNIYAQAPRDIKIQCGPGTELSADGMQALAKVDGRPQLSPYGQLCVLPELIIDGDVDYETGNVSFEGNINVRGIILDGFRVKGRGLTVKEISRATIDIAGDIMVHGGILGASIKCQGSIRAVHIHAAKIEALGNVVVEKGIFDSRIVSSGKCVTERGSIISSNIIARKGIEAAHIGTDRSKSCTLLVGVDPKTENDILRLKAAILAKEQEKEPFLEVVTRLKEEYESLEPRIGELAQTQDITAREQRAFREELEECKGMQDQVQLATVELMVQEMDAKIKNTEQELEKLFNQQDGIKDELAGQQSSIEVIDSDISDINNEIAAIEEWKESNPGNPSVRVSGLIYSGTVIKGPASSITMSNDLRSVVIKEITMTEQSKEGAVTTKKQMSVHNLA